MIQFKLLDLFRSVQKQKVRQIKFHKKLQGGAL